MKTKVVYYTKSGNTQKIANAFGEELACEVTSVDTPITEFVDILFLGASVYKFGIDKKVYDFINTLDPKMVGSVVVFSTSAMSDMGYPKLIKALSAKGIKSHSEHFYCKGSFMMMNKNRPNQDDVNLAKQFARDILKN